MSWTKADLINELASIRHYRSYLEICTPTAGLLYAAIDRARLPICHRLMYRCAGGTGDDLPVDFRSDDLDIEKAVNAIRARGLRYDVILVDAFHEYEQAARDLREAFALLAPGGTIVVHDCFPRDEALVDPRYRKGSWCGVSYKAYLDAVLGNPRLRYCTVDTDYGCGVVRQVHGPALLPRFLRRALLPVVSSARSDLMRQWKRAGNEPATSFQLLQKFSQQLLNLVTVDEFLTGERDGAPVLR